MYRGVYSLLLSDTAPLNEMEGHRLALASAGRRRVLGAAALLGPSLLSACGQPAVRLGDEASARAARASVASRIILSRDALSRELGTTIEGEQKVSDFPPNIVLAEVRGREIMVTQVVSVLETLAEAKARFEETLKANAAAKSERAEISSPGPPGTKAFGMQLPYGPPPAQSPLLMLVGQRDHYVVRVEAQALTQERALQIGARVMGSLLQRTAAPSLWRQLLGI